MDRGEEVSALQSREEAGGEAVWIGVGIQLTALLNPAQASGQMSLPGAECSTQRRSVLRGVFQFRRQGPEGTRERTILGPLCVHNARHPRIEPVPRIDRVGGLLAVEYDREFPVYDRSDQFGLVAKMAMKLSGLCAGRVGDITDRRSGYFMF